MKTFKVGDRVRATADCDGSKIAGLEGVVEEPGCPCNPLVRFEGWTDGHNGRGSYGSHNREHLWVDGSKLELIDAHAQFIICFKTDGTYAPAVKPRVFTSDKQAITVASKMAEEHGGVFVVFKAVAEAEMPKVEASVKWYDA